MLINFQKAILQDAGVWKAQAVQAVAFQLQALFLFALALGHHKLVEDFYSLYKAQIESGRADEGPLTDAIISMLFEDGPPIVLSKELKVRYEVRPPHAVIYPHRVTETTVCILFTEKIIFDAIEDADQLVNIAFTEAASKRFQYEYNDEQLVAEGTLA